MLKVALIGCGGIGEYHLSHMEHYTDIMELVGVCDIIPERADDFSNKTNGKAKAYTDFKVMLDEQKPDAVFVCVPPYCHGEIENALIDRNIDFFVEKPLALDMELIKDINKKIEEKGLITAAGFQCRYDSLGPDLKKFFHDNDIPFIDCTRFGGIPQTPWWKDKSLSGGMIVECAIHQLDYIRYVFGEPETVFTMGTTGFIKEEGYKTDDLSTTLIRFENGTLATFSTGNYTTGGNAYDSKIIFSSYNKRMEYKLRDQYELFDEQEVTEGVGKHLIKTDGGTTSSSKEGILVKNEGDYGLICDRTFLEAVISRDPSKIRSPYSDAMKSVALALACNISIETGKSVNVKDLLA